MDFVIVGGQKCGTTMLYHYLHQHPDIQVTNPKELHYFDGPDTPRAHRRFLTRLARAKKSASASSLVGEATPFYLNYPDAAPRIRRMFPNAKVLIILRNPIDRAYSHYWHEIKYGWENKPFEQALDLEPTRIARDALNWKHFSYQARGFYSVYVNEYLRCFGPSQVKIVFLESFKVDSASAFEEIFRFLDITTIPLSTLAPNQLNESKLPRFPLLSFAGGILSRSIGERNPVSRAIRLVNLRSANYPLIPEAQRSRLESLYAEDTKLASRALGLDLPWAKLAQIANKKPVFPQFGFFSSYWLPRYRQLAA